MKKIVILSFVASALFAGCCNCGKSSNNDFKSGILVDEFIYETASYPSCHSATIEETPEGMVASWFGGTKERNPDVCIWVSRQVDGKWQEGIMAADGVQNDTLRYPTWNPVLYQVPGAELILFYKVGPSPSEWWGMLKRSTDNGKTWGEAERLPDGFYGPVKNKPILLADGTLACPSSKEGVSPGWKSYFEYTKDWGKTWEKGDELNDGKVYQAIQPSLLIYPDGKMQVIARTRMSVVAGCWSEDGGKTWGLMRDIGLPNNNSGLDAVSLKNGTQMVVYNHVKTPIGAPKGHRTPLNVATSKDGKHWNAALILEDSDISQYSYPSIMQSSDGLVHIVYTWRRERIKHVVIDPEKIKETPIVYEQWPE
ncbi:MAG: exo-alpha-sialidase [Mangrovibacterium sp.]